MCIRDSLIGSLSSLGSAGKIMFIGSVFWHIGIIAMAFMEWFYPSIPLLILVGCAQSFSMVTMAMMILRYTSPEMRGRILGLRQLAVYGLPLGLLLSGYVAEDFGIFVALVLSGSAATQVLQTHSVTIEKAIGGVLLFLAVGLILRLW